MPTIKRKPRPPAEPRPSSGGPLFAWGRHPFSPRDEREELDGARVGGITIHVAPDGSLVGTVNPPEETSDD